MIASAAAFGSSVLVPNARAADGWIDFTTYLRDGPGVRYRAIDEAQSDQKVEVLDCADGWCRVAYDDSAGYVSQKALRASAPPPPTPGHQPCFVNRIAGYHGGPDVQFCAAGPAHE